MEQKDKQILRDLAKQITEIAALPKQEETRKLWRAINGLKPVRPMVMADQVCWNEMNVDDELTLTCESKEAQGWEWGLRAKLYQWRHFPSDMVMEDFIRVPKAFKNTGFGVGVVETDVRATDEKNSVWSHVYANQFTKPEDVERIKSPVITPEPEETERRMNNAADIFGDSIKIVSYGADPYLSVWDPISSLMSVEGACYALADDPDMMHAIVKKYVDGYMSMLDQFEEYGLLCHSQALIHCTGAYADDLPAPGFNPDKPRTKDVWMFGLAQMFSTVSPAMFEEFELLPNMPIFERFGLVYYGCCDPLDLKMKEVRRIPNCRKISMSPWVNKERGASQIGKDYVFSNKPNPAFLATATFDEDLVRNDLTETKNICEKYGCPVEFILKDISTVRYEPKRLWRWTEIALEVANS
ncbi:MAG: hypothetical protein FWE82_02080 [Defluviitaleaceae bacterium]|nr:hypothetical protein [Defluviitaleaceae bacterium]